MCAGLLFSPAAGHAKRGLPDYVVEKSYSDDNDDNTTGSSVLIAYATNYGSTYRIADVIAEVLSAEGCRVDLKSADNDSIDLTKYDAVILGSNIYIENWNEKALAFLDANKTDLASMKVAYFCVCAVLGTDLDGKEEEYAAGYIKKIADTYPEIIPRDTAAFAGAVDYRILTFKDWWLLRLMFMQPGNWTDYAEVVSWAYEVSDKLQ
jgi:menaquinone-dependent protoporphyrinogen oxidase